MKTQYGTTVDGGISAAELNLLFVGLAVFLAQLVWCVVTFIFTYSYAFVSDPEAQRWMMYSV